MECTDPKPPQKPIKILHIAASTTGGVGLLLLYLARYLDKERFDTSVAFGKGYPLDDQFISESIAVYPVHLSRRWSLFSTLPLLRGLIRLFRIIKKNRFHIVHTHTSFGGLAGRLAARLAGTPVILWEIHGYASHDYQNPLKRHLFMFIERFMDRFTDHYIAVSEAMKQEGIQKRIMVPEKVTVIRNGVDVKSLDIDYNVDKIKQALGLRGNSPVVGTVTRLEPQKAVDDLLRAAAIVKEQYPRTTFLIVGNGPLRGPLEKMARDLHLDDQVRFIGWRSDIPEILSTFDIFCLSSLWEGLPMTLLEAMALGKPIVATDVGGVREVVEDGETGFLSPPASPGYLAERIVALIKDSAMARNMGQKGKQRVETFFTVEKMIAQYEAFYLDVVRHSRSHRIMDKRS
jgi:glycosyltransferase involved in cell wall biosynthesis